MELVHLLRTTVQTRNAYNFFLMDIWNTKENERVTLSLLSLTKLGHAFSGRLWCYY